MSINLLGQRLRAVEVDTGKIRAELTSDVDAFIAAGGKIETLPRGATAPPAKGFGGSIEGAKHPKEKPNGKSKTKAPAAAKTVVTSDG